MVAQAYQSLLKPTMSPKCQTRNSGAWYTLLHFGQWPEVSLPSLTFRMGMITLFYRELKLWEFPFSFCRGPKLREHLKSQEWLWTSE